MIRSGYMAYSSIFLSYGLFFNTILGYCIIPGIAGLQVSGKLYPTRNVMGVPDDEMVGPEISLSR